MHILTYAFWGIHMHCMYVCICIPPIHAIQHAIFNTYTYALAGSLMKMIRDAKNQTIAHPLVKQPKMRKYLPDLVIFFKLAKVVI